MNKPIRSAKRDLTLQDDKDDHYKRAREELEDQSLSNTASNKSLKDALSDKLVQKIEEEKQRRLDEVQRVYDEFYGTTQEDEVDRSYFKAKYLSERARSYDFLNSVVSHAYLRKLKKVIGSTYYDENCKFGAILVEIHDHRLIEIYGGKFLFEVWANGVMIYQRPLTKQPRAWNASRHMNSIIFLLDPEDEQNQGTDIIHVLSMNEACDLTDFNSLTNLIRIVKEIKIQDWTGLCSNPENIADLHFGLDKNMTLFMSIPSELHAVSLTNLEGGGSDTTSWFDVNVVAPLHTLGPETRMGSITFPDQFRCLWQYDTQESYQHEQGFSCLAIFDNQGEADFNMIETENDPENQQKLNITLVQLVEPVQEKSALEKITDNAFLAKLQQKYLRVKDRITQIQNIQLIDRQKQITVVLRQSGHVDLYWNCRKISTTKDFKNDLGFTYTSIKANFESILLERYSRDMASHSMELALDQEQRTNFKDMSMRRELTEDEDSFFINQKYTNLVNAYQEIFMHNKTLIVAHGNIISYFTLTTNQWRYHLQFSDSSSSSKGPKQVSLNYSFAFAIQKKVLKMFQYHSDQSQFSIGILFQDGSFKRIEFNKDVNGHDNFKELDVEGIINGQIVSIASDREHHRILYVVAIENGDAKLWGFTNGNLFLCKKATVTPDSKIVSLFSPSDNTQIAILTPEENLIRVYEHETQIDHETSSEGQIYLNQKRVKKIRQDKMSKQICMKSVHTIVATQNEELYVLFDKKNMFVYNLRNAEIEEDENKLITLHVKDVTCHYNMNVRSLQLLENRFMYLMYNNVKRGLLSSDLSPEQRANAAQVAFTSGLGFMDSSTLIDDPTVRPTIVPIMKAICGVNSEIMYSRYNQKIVMMQGFNRIAVLPLLHLNMVPFDDMGPKNQYLFARQFQDKFVALDGNKDKVFQWDMQTGQPCEEMSVKPFKISQNIQSIQRARNSEFTVFRSKQETIDNRQSIYDQGVLPYSLLYCNRQIPPEDGVKDETFFQHRLQKNHQSKQIPYLKALQKEYNTFVAVGLSEDGEMEVKVHFAFPRVLENEQHLFLSKDYDRLLDIQDDNAVIYALEKIPGTNSKEAKVRFEGHVKHLPFGAYDRDINQLFCMFSPDFKKHIDFDPQNQQWIIRESIGGSTFFEIPKTFLSFNPKETDSVFMQTRFMAWENNQRLSLIDIDADPVIHEIIELPQNNDEDSKMKSFEIASGVIPYIDIQEYSESYKKNPETRKIGVFNYFKGNVKMDIADVHNRLKRMHQILKTIFYLREQGDRLQDKVPSRLRKFTEEGSPIISQIKQATEEQQQESQGKVEGDAEVEESEEYNPYVGDPGRYEELYSNLLRVDYVSDPQRFWIEMPFTFIKWRAIEMIELLCQQTSLQASSAVQNLPFTTDVAQNICLQILPNCKTVLHCITKNYQFLVRFLSIAQQKVNPDDEDEEPFIVPFIEDLDGKTALHASSIVFKTANTRSTEYFLTQFLPKQPFDHHGRAVVDVIPELVKQELPFLGTYMDSRLMTTKQLKKMCRQNGKTIKDRWGDTNSEGQFVTTADIWPDESIVIERAFEPIDQKTCNSMNEVIDNPDQNANAAGGEELEIEFLDLPRLHQPYNQIANDFVEALANVEDLKIFQYKSVRSIIGFRWEITYKYVMMSQLLPYLGFFFMYDIYAYVIRNFRIYMGDDSPLWFKFVDNLTLLGLIAFSIYFIWNELPQIKQQQWDYLHSGWNYADILPPIGIILSAFIDLFIKDPGDIMLTITYAISGISSFLMWIKLFYFLRIFRKTGYFVNMLLRVIREIKVFGLLYIMLIFVFGFTFFIMAPSGISIWTFLNATYLIGLGQDDINNDEFTAPVMFQLFYILATAFITIIMLNLLIAIVSQVYEEIVQTQQEANDYERIALINDVKGQINEEDKTGVCDPNEYIIRVSIAQSQAQKSDKEEAD